MIFKFKKQQFSDVVKVVDFLDKQGIDYEVLTDMQIAIPRGDDMTEVLNHVAHAQRVKPEELEPSDEPDYIARKPGETWMSGIDPLPARDPDPLWKPAQHDNKLCTDKEGCKAVQHYGAQPL